MDLTTYRYKAEAATVNEFPYRCTTPPSGNNTFYTESASYEQNLPISEIIRERLMCGSFQDVINCDDTRLDIHVIIELFNQVRSKLNLSFEHSQAQFSEFWGVTQFKIEKQRDRYGDRDSSSGVILKQAEETFEIRTHRFLQKVDDISKVAERLGKELLDQYQQNELAFAETLINSRDTFMPLVVQLLTDVDLLSHDIVHLYEDLNEYLITCSKSYDRIDLEMGFVHSCH